MDDASIGEAINAVLAKVVNSACIKKLDNTK